MPWQPGQSGNPRGRPVSAARLTLKARKHCKEAIALCLAVMRDMDASRSVRLYAAGMILDRGLGKPAQGTTASCLTDEELMAELLLRKKVRDAVAERASAGAGPDADQ